MEPSPANDSSVSTVEPYFCLPLSEQTSAEVAQIRSSNDFAPLMMKLDHGQQNDVADARPDTFIERLEVAIERQIQKSLQKHHEELLLRLRCFLPLGHSGDLSNASLSSLQRRVPDKADTKSEVGTLCSTSKPLVTISEPSFRASRQISKLKSASRSFILEQVPLEERMLQLAMGPNRTNSSLSQLKREYTLSADQPDKRVVHKTKNCIKRILRSPIFELAIGGVVLTNAIFIGAEVEYMSGHPDNHTAPLQFTVVSYCYSALFLIELIARLVSGCRNFFWRADESTLLWNCLDIFIVTSSLVEVGLDIAAHYGSTREKVDMSNVRVIRMVRVFRLIRLMRVARFVRFVRALHTLVYSIWCTLKSVFWSLVLMATIIYVFAIVFTQASATYMNSKLNSGRPDIAQLHRHWGSLGTSALSLFMSVSGGISWVEVTQPLACIGSGWVYIFLLYISFLYFAVLNVVTGVFCQAAIEGHAEDKESMVNTVLRHKQLYTERFKEIFKEIDQDGSGRISLHEFVDRMGDAAVEDYFASLDLYSVDALCLFDVLDDAAEEGIQVDEFVMGCIRLKGAARSSDMIRLLHENRRLMDNLDRVLGHFDIAGEKRKSYASNLLLEKSGQDITTSVLVTPRVSSSRML